MTLLGVWMSAAPPVQTIFGAMGLLGAVMLELVGHRGWPFTWAPLNGYCLRIRGRCFDTALMWTMGQWLDQAVLRMVQWTMGGCTLVTFSIVLAMACELAVRWPAFGKVHSGVLGRGSTHWHASIMRKDHL